MPPVSWARVRSILSAAVLAAANYLDWTPVIASASAGAYLGDQLFFQLGRGGRGLPFTPSPTWRRRLSLATRLMERHRLKLLLGYRFLYGLRSVIPFAIGASGCRTISFMGFSGIGTLVWVAANCVAGALLSGLWGWIPVDAQAVLSNIIGPAMESGRP